MWIDKYKVKGSPKVWICITRFAAGKRVWSSRNILNQSSRILCTDTRMTGRPVSDIFSLIAPRTLVTYSTQPGGWINFYVSEEKTNKLKEVEVAIYIHTGQILPDYSPWSA